MTEVAETSPSEQPHRRADAVRNRTALLAVARQLVDGGDVALPLNHVAKRAGLGVGTAYRHFPTRQALLESLALGSLEELLAVARTVLELPDTGEGLRILLRQSLACLLCDRALSLVLRAGDPVHARANALQIDLATTIGAFLDRAREHGVIRPELTATHLRRYILGLETSVRLTDQSDAVIDEDLGVLLRGLQP